MIEAEIPPEDLRELMLDLKGLRPEHLFKGHMGPFVKEIGMQTGKYPPPMADSAYVRTGHLGRSWYYNVIDSLSAEVGNLAIYAGWVHGPKQVDYHGAHGWRRLYEMGDKTMKAFVRKMEERIDRIWRS